MAFTATKDLMLPATVTGSWPRPRWYTQNMWGRPLDTAMMDPWYREQFTDAHAIVVPSADPDSALNRRWDEEHDRYVVRFLLALVEEEFEPLTLQTFRRLALDSVSGAAAAEELGLSVSAVYVAKSRVLARIRQEAEGLID